MHWKVKAALQNAIAALPSRLSYATYYTLQRRFGRLAAPDAVEPLTAGVQTWTRILKQGVDPAGKTFFEVGTGRAPLVPLAYWLMGAGRTITVDVNPYLQCAIIVDALEYITKNLPHVTKLFGDFLQRDRIQHLLHWHRTQPFSLHAFMSLCAIEYLSPADAARTGLPAQSVDFHTSYTVFEHIPRDELLKILREGNRITRDNGLFVHLIDYSDHFSHTDPRISSINFLQYSDARWVRYADNRYMYMNRLRHDDMMSLFQDAGHCFVEVSVTIDEKVRELLQAALVQLDARFEQKPREVLSIRDAWIVSRNATTANYTGNNAVTVSNISNPSPPNHRGSVS